MRQIAETITKFTEMLSTKQKEADEFQKKHKIVSQGGSGGAPKKAAEDEEESSAAGVLI